MYIKLILDVYKYQTNTRYVFLYFYKINNLKKFLDSVFLNEINK